VDLVPGSMGRPNAGSHMCLGTPLWSQVGGVAIAVCRKCAYSLFSGISPGENLQYEVITPGTVVWVAGVKVMLAKKTYSYFIVSFSFVCFNWMLQQLILSLKILSSVCWIGASIGGWGLEPPIPLPHWYLSFSLFLVWELFCLNLW
jgi:hypothetical protein